MIHDRIDWENKHKTAATLVRISATNKPLLFVLALVMELNFVFVYN